jgi:hypothetical protein
VATGAFFAALFGAGDAVDRGAGEAVGAGFAASGGALACGAGTVVDGPSTSAEVGVTVGVEEPPFGVQPTATSASSAKTASA